MEVIYSDATLAVVIKPAGAASTDVPGGVPELLRQALGDPAANVRTVHRLDQVVGGLMVLARTKRAAAELSQQIVEGSFRKTYLAVCRGGPEADAGRLEDLLARDLVRRVTYVAAEPGKGVQPAALDYAVLGRKDGLALVRIGLLTGRTHQIRCQFASRGWPLVGERKYAQSEDGCGLALWSHALEFTHPKTGQRMAFSRLPADAPPWNRWQLTVEN